MRRALLTIFLLTSSTSSWSETAASPRTIQGRLPDGASWQATVPSMWNGTLLLWSHGYARTMPVAEDSPRQHRDALLRAGYALAGSTYADAGWALESAPGDQLATLEAVRTAIGKPKRVIAWGMSMGGLVTSAIAERRPRSVDGAVAMCSSIGGAVGMMNMALDGAYAFRTLIAPRAGIELTNVHDDLDNSRRVSEALAAAQQTPQGRARVMLAAVLGGLPRWTTADVPPSDGDLAGEEAEMARTFVMGVMLPRTDQERRAGGGFSWNSGVDYRRQLERSGRLALVRAMYAAANLDLDSDLSRLNSGQRIAARPGAISYMMRNYTPNARPLVPLLAVQKTGDGLTSPSLQQAYLDAARPAASVAGLWVAEAGHCNFSTTAILDSLRYIGERLDTGRWPARPAGFVEHHPSPMLRPCMRGGRCL